MTEEFRIRSVELARGFEIHWLERRAARKSAVHPHEFDWLPVAGSFKRELLEQHQTLLLNPPSDHSLLPEGIFAPNGQEVWSRGTHQPG